MINIKIQKENLMLLGASFTIALFLWLQIHNQVDPLSKEGFDLMLQIKNLSGDMVITKKNDRIGIIVEGPISLLKTFTLDSVEAYLDLSNAKIGIKEYPVKLNLKELHGLSVYLKKPTEKLAIENLLRSSIPVTIKEKGIPSNEILYGGASAKPNIITLIGPASSVKKVQIARAILDLRTLSFNSTYLSNVQPLDNKNEVITDVKTDPSTVLLTASVTSAPVQKWIPINVVWKGNLPFGYHLKAFNVKPNQILISGNSLEVSKISSIETLPIDLNEINKSQTLKIGLKSIPSVQIKKMDLVEIDLNVELLTP